VVCPFAVVVVVKDLRPAPVSPLLLVELVAALAAAFAAAAKSGKFVGGLIKAPMGKICGEAPTA
jgi:hypothetical protein